MGTKKIGVGFVGVTPGRSWAARTHIPGLRTLPAYQVVAVANSSLASSLAAAEAMGIPHAYSSAAELAAADDVDMVVITVKVPHHKQLVDAALDASKMVFCEWPLGNGLAEAEAMVARAAGLGVRTAVGLQARNSPTIRYLRDLIRDGYIGEVLSTTLVGSAGVPGAAQMPEAYAYLSQRSNGATMMTIPFGHTIDTLCWCLGDFRSVWATQALRRTSFTVSETGETRSTDAEDQLVIGGVLANGVIVSAHYRGGLSRGTTMLWEINGTEGDLQITAPLGHLQMSQLTLRGGRGGDKELAVMEVPQKYRTVDNSLEGPAVAVAEEYARFAEGPEGADPVPGFADALKLHRLLDAMERSAATGTRIDLQSQE